VSSNNHIPSHTSSSRTFPVSVLKFGSSVLRGDAGLRAAVAEIYREVRSGYRVLAVVSALPGVTDALTESAASRFESPDPSCLARLLATGESASAALLGMALDEAGIPVSVIDPRDVDLTVSGPSLDAEPVALDVRSLRRVLRRRSVAVLPGFFGKTRSGETAVLGRGGSDFTALFAACALRAERCRLLKDVDGIFTADPCSGVPAARYATLSWDDALSISARVIQQKALRFARARRYEFTVASLFSQGGTRIGAVPARLRGTEAIPRPLRVALLGLGTVGLGVFQYLAARPDLFELTGIVVRDLSKPRDPKVPRRLLSDDAWQVLSRPTDVVIELIGGVEPAVSLIRAALKSGVSVVTANKAVLARAGKALDALARDHGVRLLGSASVGGAVPVLERLAILAREARIESVTGVLNGTCNYVLEKVSEGVQFSEAVRQAQNSGFAEADPSLDLGGGDSAHKIAVLARAVFGAAVDPDQIPCRGIDGIDPERVRTAASRGRAFRLIAACRRTPDGVALEVRPRELPLRHPLSRASGVENRVLVRLEGRDPVLLNGKGAGRWPTAVSVFGDILELLTGAGSRQYGSQPATAASGRDGIRVKQAVPVLSVSLR
jgi:homoserine dehydrogenase